MSAQGLVASHAGVRNVGYAAVLGAGFLAGVLAGVLVSGSLAPGSAHPLDTEAAQIAPVQAADLDAAASLRYRTALADLAAARAQHDSSAVARYRANVDRMLSEPSVVGAIYADRARLAANMAAAEQHHDRRMLAAFRVQLAALCPPGGPDCAWTSARDESRPRCGPRRTGMTRGVEECAIFTLGSPGSGVVGNARALGARDRGFESRLPDHISPPGQ